MSKILLDCDGVTMDFVSAACLVHGRPGYQPTQWGFFEHDWGMTSEEFWEPIHSLGDKFYDAFVYPYPWAKKLLESCKATDEVIFVTSCHQHFVSVPSKVRWIQRHLCPDTHIVITSDKHLLAKPDRLLIDDYQQNIFKFAEAGGQTLVFPQPWNDSHAISNNPLRHVEVALDHWMYYKSNLIGEEA